MRVFGLHIAMCLICWQACLQVWAQAPLFTQMPANHTGVSFVNTVQETDELHIFKYEYLYNGHGIGVADFDQDGLMDIFIAGNAVPNKLYINSGNFTFKDVTAKAKVAGNGYWRTGVTIADVNGDGLPDIYVCHSGPLKGGQLANALYIHQGVKDGVPIFKEMAAEYGLDAPGTLSTHAVFFDYDQDGDLDMFLLNHSNHTVNPYLNTRKVRATPNMQFGNRLFRNDRQKNGSMLFTDVTLQAGIVNNALNFGLAVVVSDLNRDGWPDIYTTSDYTEQDYCYINNKDGTFTQVLQQSFPHISRFSMGADIADINNDGWLDVLTLDMLPEDNFRQKLLKGADQYDAYHMLLDSGYYHQQMRNMLHLNRGIDQNGQLRFSEIGQYAGISNTDWSWAPLLADFDNDGHKDLVITNGYLRDFTDNDFLKYTVADEQLAQAAKGNFNYQTYELVKKMPSNTLSNYAFRNRGNLQFENVSTAWGLDFNGVSNAAVYADLDNDGDLDLIVGNNNSAVLLYRNEATALQKGNWLQIELSGRATNTMATGARVELYAAGQLQVQEAYPVRGYQSSVSPVLHFGLATTATIDSIRIVWPQGKVSTHTVNRLNQRVKIGMPLDAQPHVAVTTSAPAFSLPQGNAGVTFVHKENDFVDFKGEVLLPYQLSRIGPALAKADVNRDGLEDFFVGGAIDQAGRLYLQQPNGTFATATYQPWMADKACEDVKALFADFNKDGYPDLYVASGGNEYDAGAPEYADRIYLNDGKGRFSKAQVQWPLEMLAPTCAVAAADVDADGYIDLFVGGGAVPGNFPKAGLSFLLKNESRGNLIKFSDATAMLGATEPLEELLMSAVFADINADGKPDLLLAGEWMPLRYFEHTGSGFVEKGREKGLQDDGLWSTLYITDLNNDGLPDIVAGNVGTNLQFKANPSEPLNLVVTDIDDNEQDDVLFCYYIQGNMYPAASRDELLDQVVPLRKKFVKYRQYAEATLETIVPPHKLATAQMYKVTEQQSVVYYQQSNGTFTKKALPAAAQWSRVNDVQEMQLQGKRTLLLQGNFYPWRVQWGRSDASYGVAMQQQNDGSWQVVENRDLGYWAGGDVRGGLHLKGKEGRGWLLLGINDEKVQVLKIQ